MSEQQPKSLQESQTAFLKMMLNGDGKMMKPFPPEYLRGRHRGYEHFRESPEYKTLKFMAEERLAKGETFDQMMEKAFARMNEVKAKKRPPEVAP